MWWPLFSDSKRYRDKGGFTLTKFIVNDMELLEEVPEEHRAKEVKDFGPNSAGRALGIKWNIMSDTFYFDVNYELQEPVTRRQLLSAVSSMFDPLGLISPIILTGKLIFQEATRQKLSWDEPLPCNLLQDWIAWIRLLDGLKNIYLSRCIKPSSFDDAMIELHHFSDARQHAYGCCSYIRCINKEGCIDTQLVMSKCKVAPLKQSTIPRLELQGAVMAAKVDHLPLKKGTWYKHRSIFL